MAYTNANHGDLKYGPRDGGMAVWTVDSRGSTGHYPSLAFARDDAPVITYYDKTNGDLRMASGHNGKWTRRTLDAGSTGTTDVGRFSDLALDPSRHDETRWAVVYEDTAANAIATALKASYPAALTAPPRGTRPSAYRVPAGSADTRRSPSTPRTSRTSVL